MATLFYDQIDRTLRPEPPHPWLTDLVSLQKILTGKQLELPHDAHCRECELMRCRWYKALYQAAITDGAVLNLPEELQLRNGSYAPDAVQIIIDDYDYKIQCLLRAKQRDREYTTRLISR